MIVGVAGINFYARTPGATIAAVDVDLLLEPAVSNLRRLTRLRRGIRPT